MKTSAQAYVTVAAHVCAAVVALGCEADASRLGPGLELQLQVADAQLMRGGLAADAGGPAVSQVLRPQPEVVRGDADVGLSGRLGPSGVALHLQAVGDEDHWLVQPNGFDFVVPDELLWKARLGFSYAIQGDQLELLLQAVGSDGRAGPLERTSFVLLPDVPPAQLYISLGWDAAVDLDLSVELPDGTVIGSKNTNSFEPPSGQQSPPDAWMRGGWHDFDSNQHCQLDLRNRENVMWLAAAPPSGRYRVYAQLFSACEQPSVNFTATVVKDGRLTDEVDGSLYEFDARVHPADGEAPGLLVLEFEVK